MQARKKFTLHHRYVQGFTRLAQETTTHVRDARLFMAASSLAYTTILSIIPVLAVSFAVFQAFGGMQKVYSTIEPLVLSYLAEGQGDAAIQTLHRFIDNANAGAIGIGGMIGLIFTCMTMLNSVEKAFNQVWGTRTARTLFQRVSSYWLFITLGPLALSVAIGAATSFDFPIAKLFPSGTGIFIGASVFFFIIYRWVPNTRVHWQPATISAVTTAALWNIARWGYNLYTSKVLTYHKVYGSLGAIPIFLLWIYILWLIVLGGAAFTAVLQKRLKAVA
ncbi:MAG: YhjD/YihY/BrkB family envelope integrity protein [Bdellovibrionota bacterium]